MAKADTTTTVQTTPPISTGALEESCQLIGDLADVIETACTTGIALHAESPNYDPVSQLALIRNAAAVIGAHADHLSGIGMKGVEGWIGLPELNGGKS